MTTRWSSVGLILAVAACGAHRGYSTSNFAEAAVVTATVALETAMCKGPCAMGARRNFDSRSQSAQVIPETLLGEDRFDRNDHSVLPDREEGPSETLPTDKLR